MSTEQGDVAAVARGLRAAREFINLLPLTDGASQKAKDREFIAVKLIPEGLMALDRLAVALERAERERDDALRAAEDQFQSVGNVGRLLGQAEARAEKAERALAEIEVSEPDWAKGVDENCETLRSIARAALPSSEDTSDES